MCCFNDFNCNDAVHMHSQPNWKPIILICWTYSSHFNLQMITVTTILLHSTEYYDAYSAAEIENQPEITGHGHGKCSVQLLIHFV